MSVPSQKNPEVLHSWKDISAYTGRSVRTVQRWEQMFNFPVHRTSGELKGSVMAFRTEIDSWLRARALRPHHARPNGSDGMEQQRLHLHSKVTTFQEKSEVLRRRIHELRQGTEELAAALRRTAELRARLARPSIRSAV